MIQVLLSTYNGQKYLKELMDSVLNQDFSELKILVRDDGSTDETLRVLEKYSGLKNVQILQGENIGVIKSFFNLLEISSPNAKYIAFCDQDDVWKKDKISRVISILERQDDNIPTMYCSRVTLVDENLKILGFSQIPRRELAFGNALVQNVATGCTIVINNVARQLILKKLPLSAMIHDWWIYLVVSAFGKVIYDLESRILYRQHSSNLIGVESNFFKKWIKKIRRFLKYGRIPFATIQAEEFSQIYRESLPLDKKIILDHFINERSSFISRLSYVFRGETYRQSRIENIIFRLLIILNRV